MPKRLLAMTAAAFTLAGCALATVPSPMNRPAGVGAMASRGETRSVTQLVDRNHLSASLAVLTGKNSFAGGTLINERGSEDGRARTRQFITQSLQAMGYTVGEHRYRSSGANILANLRADAPTNEYVLLGAHMDSVRNAGADDNASGSASVLEAARVLRELKGRKVNVIFAWFDEEELGLVGSRYLAKEYRKQGLKLLAAHTADMVGYDADKDRVIEIEQPDGMLWDYYQMVNNSHGLNYPLRRTSSGSTDHEAFRAEGFPSVGLCEEWVGKDTTPYYHKKTDTFETIDVDFMAAVTRLMVAAVGDQAQAIPAPPGSRFIPHTQFPGRDRRCGHDASPDHLH